ncbi:drug/metabolite transporter (DMT)-like permease [Streptomyces sp. V4I23]|nr:drug/metabolite transporter (DMT)-like permease [Streptomyces sp. V4I23]
MSAEGSGPYGRPMTNPIRRTQHAQWPALVAAGVTVVLWASAFVSIRSAGEAYSPGALALGRLLAGSLALGCVLLVRREGLPPRAAWPGIVVSGLLWFGVYMVVLNWGEQEVDAGTAAMVVNIGPVLIALLGARLLGEVPAPLTLAGGALCLAGVAVSRSRPRTGSTAGMPVTPRESAASPPASPGRPPSRPARRES